MHLCQCGCGLAVGIAPCSDRNKGWVKGQPYRYAVGHGSRTAAARGYRVARGERNKRLHVVRAERALGKPLPLKAVVHHADGSKADDAPLVICQDQAYHFLLHARMRIKAAGGNPNADKICATCQAVKSRADFGPNHRTFDGLHQRCRACDRALAAEYREKKRMSA